MKTDLHDLPAALNLQDAAKLVGISRTAAYELVRTGTWPSPVLRLGHRIKIPTQPLLELLGLPTGDRHVSTTRSTAQAG
jgi:predicted site-specific integrase-resolvase